MRLKDVFISQSDISQILQTSENYVLEMHLFSYHCCYK